MCDQNSDLIANLDIVIVNWNSGNQLQNCLFSIFSTKHHGVRIGHVVVVDNGSKDDSLKVINSYSLPITIIRNQVNRGFAAACNQGASLCTSRYLLFLNPDTKLFDNTLSVPLAFMEDSANQEIGICGIQLIGENGAIARSCSKFPSLSKFFFQSVGLNKIPFLRRFGLHMTEWDHLTSMAVDQVMGAFFFTRHDVFDDLQGFDERFFVYFEEVDFSVRARQKDWKTFYLAEAQAFHQGGGTSQQVKSTRLFYSLRSRILYGFKHFSRHQAWVLLGMTMLLEPISRILFCAVGGKWSGIMETLHGYTILWKNFAGVMRARDAAQR